jgi:hypothetical protein
LFAVSVAVVCTASDAGPLVGAAPNAAPPSINPATIHIVPRIFVRIAAPAPVLVHSVLVESQGC